jgi:hypothetical protein
LRPGVPQSRSAEVKWVVLDPVPEDVNGALVELLSLDRERFVETLFVEETPGLRGYTSSLDL